MTDSSDQSKILAFAIYEIRQLLSGHLGSDYEGDQCVNLAAHLSYALHNQALAVLEGKSFNAADAVTAIAAVDKMLGANFVHRLSQATSGEA